MAQRFIDTAEYQASRKAAQARDEADLVVLIAKLDAKLPDKIAARLEEIKAVEAKQIKNAAKASKAAETRAKNAAAAAEAKAAGSSRSSRSSRSAAVVDDDRQRAPSLTLTDTSSITERSEAQTPPPEVQQIKKRKATAKTQPQSKKRKH